TVESGQLVTFTAVNETTSKWVGSVPNAPDTYFTDPSYNYYLVTGSLWNTSYFDASNPSVPGKFQYRMTNNYTKPVVVKFTFTVKTFTRNPGGSSTQLTVTDEALPSITITVTPKVIPVTPPTHYYINGTSVTYAAYQSALTYDRYGQSGSGIGTTGPNLLEEKHYTPQEAATKFTLTDGGDAYELSTKGGVLMPW
ncbi:hypothetical protein DBR11_21535, partial [Pedobacter sp. HMWF019]|uniref:hypothetical protein n=1 Tax=Pedobacter sp. HMWF019 TaxID=2056856 RepID=UPI000D4676B2